MSILPNHIPWERGLLLLSITLLILCSEPSKPPGSSACGSSAFSPSSLVTLGVVPGVVPGAVSGTTAETRERNELRTDLCATRSDRRAALRALVSRFENFSTCVMPEVRWGGVVSYVSERQCAATAPAREPLRGACSSSQ